ncbi:hypothetical protein H4R24_005054 [Coemansia sp. RSA 988]|nr:hypothetical protein H4R24_005054 [Coemansia sp. RSA 988]
MASDSDELIDTTVEWSGEAAKRVAIRGTFSKDSKQWWQETIELTPSEDSSRFSKTLRLWPGRYEFKFVINGSEWRVNPALYPTAEDGRGNVNNIIDVAYPAQQQAETTLTIDYARTRGGGSDITLGRSDISATASMVSDHGATSTQVTAYFSERSSVPRIIALYSENNPGDDALVAFLGSLDVALPESIAHANYRVDGAEVANTIPTTAGDSPGALKLPDHVVSATTSVAPVSGASVNPASGMPPNDAAPDFVSEDEDDNDSAIVNPSNDTQGKVLIIILMSWQFLSLKIFYLQLETFGVVRCY